MATKRKAAAKVGGKKAAPKKCCEGILVIEILVPKYPKEPKVTKVSAARPRKTTRRR